jgi:two-component system invasion response regulator UvrY
MDEVEEAPVSVLVVDDQAPFRRAAATVVALTKGFEMVGEAKSGEEAATMVDALAPALVLMDINMDGIDGIEATRRIKAAHPDVIVLLLSTYAEDDLPPGARTCGAAAYLNKEEFGPAALKEFGREVN